MRKLGIDFGTKKVGLALTDESGAMAFPHSVVPNDDSLLETIEALITNEGVDTVVIGHSLNLSGEPNPVQADIDGFIADLTLRTPIPIHLEPEQFTSQAAARETGKNDQTDAGAAALILEGWLQKEGSTTTDTAPVEEEVEDDSIPEITYDQFAAVEIKLGTIEAVEIVEGADKLLKLTVNVGEDTSRQILSGIREYFEDEQTLVGLQCPFITNLAPRKIRGLQSQGMILAADAEGTFAMFNPSTPLPPGTRLF